MRLVQNLILEDGVG